MKDIQTQLDTRKIPIDKVGVKDIRYPITVLDRRDKEQHTTASINMYVNLPHQFKGTHMSRFVEILNEHHKSIHVEQTQKILQQMRLAFDAQSAHIEMLFPYFIEKKAPVSGIPGLMEYQCSFEAVSSFDGDDFVMGIVVPVMTLCPCSKEISDYGAHNQRGNITLKIRSTEMIWLEELIETVESCASAPVYSLLKRPDEKFITEQSYDNPKFVEDVVRDVAVAMNKDKRVSWYKISTENFESIHNHSAYAYVEKNKLSQ